MFKYELDQLVYYLLENKIHSAKVLSRCLVENQHENWDATDAQTNLFKAFGDSGVFYSTCHTVLNEEQVFASKEDLAASLTR